jgi:hypothetical protein
MTPATLESRVAALDAATWLDTIASARSAEDLAGGDEDDDEEEDEEDG